MINPHDSQPRTTFTNSLSSIQHNVTHNHLTHPIQDLDKVKASIITHPGRFILNLHAQDAAIFSALIYTGGIVRLLGDDSKLLGDGLETRNNYI
jgi:hypothetical protein